MPCSTWSQRSPDRERRKLPQPGRRPPGPASHEAVARRDGRLSATARLNLARLRRSVAGGDAGGGAAGDSRHHADEHPRQLRRDESGPRRPRPGHRRLAAAGQCPPNLPATQAVSSTLAGSREACQGIPWHCGRPLPWTSEHQEGGPGVFDLPTGEPHSRAGRTSLLQRGPSRAPPAAGGGRRTDRGQPRPTTPGWNTVTSVAPTRVSSTPSPGPATQRRRGTLRIRRKARPPRQLGRLPSRRPARSNPVHNQLTRAA
jgi:hypothetical protein